MEDHQIGSTAALAAEGPDRSSAGAGGLCDDDAQEQPATSEVPHLERPSWLQVGVASSPFIHLTHSIHITENPFASSASLDRNPFEDPFADAEPSAHTSSRAAELEQRERDLERRERELQQKSEHIRRHGRNNFPPC